MDTLAIVRIRDADHGNLCDRWVRRDGIFHLGAEHVLATGDDHVLDPVADEQEPFLVLVGDITGADPAINDGLGGFLRLAPVSDHAGRAARQDFSGHVWLDVVTLIIDDPDLDASKRLADGQGLRIAGDLKAGLKKADRGPHFGLAIDMQQIDVRQIGLQLAQDRLRNGGRSEAQAAQTGEAFGRISVSSRSQVSVPARSAA